MNYLFSITHNLIILNLKIDMAHFLIILLCTLTNKYLTYIIESNKAWYQYMYLVCLGLNLYQNMFFLLYLLNFHRINPFFLISFALPIYTKICLFTITLWTLKYLISYFFIINSSQFTECPKISI